MLLTCQFNTALFNEVWQIFIVQRAIVGTIGQSQSTIFKYKSKAIYIALILQDFIYFIYYYPIYRPTLIKWN